MMFYSTFMQYFKNDNRGSYSRLIKQYQYWYDKDDRKECQQIFEKGIKSKLTRHVKLWRTLEIVTIVWNKNFTQFN